MEAMRNDGEELRKSREDRPSLFEMPLTMNGDIQEAEKPPARRMRHS
jgi:hypothetical protein